jgi:hypothetical protein
MTVGDLLDLAASRPRDGESAIKQSYEWRRDIWKTTAIALLTAALSLIASLAVSELKSEITASPWQVWVIAGSAVVVAMVAGLFLLQAARVQREYIVALSIYALLTP